jgi:CheY-like chemotaxis protein
MENGRKPGSLCVLVADHDEPAAAQTALQFQWWGHEPHLAYEGEQALQKAIVVKPDLMLVALSLPQCNGFRLVRQLRQQPELAATHFIALAAALDDAQKRQARATGFFDFLVKPVPPMELLRVFLKARDTVSRSRSQSLNSQEIIAQGRQLTHASRETLERSRRLIERTRETLDQSWTVGRDLE